MKVSNNISIHSGLLKNDKTILTNPGLKKIPLSKYVVHSAFPVSYKDGTAKLSLMYKAIAGGFPDSGILSIFSRIFNSRGVELGQYSYTINSLEKTISNGFLFTNPYVRNKGIGEILRLSSLIEFKENPISAIELYSLPNAIPFHSKYKFVPNLRNTISSKEILKYISEEEQIKKCYRTEAKKMIDLIEKKPGGIRINDEQFKNINGFVCDFINNHLKVPEIINKFPYSLPMLLTRERLFQFADFFNDLFKKHKIDYKI